MPWSIIKSITPIRMTAPPDLAPAHNCINLSWRKAYNTFVMFEFCLHEDIFEHFGCHRRTTTTRCSILVIVGRCIHAQTSRGTKYQTLWLASAMEMLAGYNPSDPKLTLEVEVISLKEQTNDKKLSIDYYKNNNNSNYNNAPDDMIEMSGDEPSDLMVDTALVELLEDLQPTNVVLAIAKMCCLAKPSIMENIYQSIAAPGGGGNKEQNKSGGGLLLG
jgi:hypothetical protein